MTIGWGWLSPPLPGQLGPAWSSMVQLVTLLLSLKPPPNELSPGQTTDYSYLGTPSPYSSSYTFSSLPLLRVWKNVGEVVLLDCFLFNKPRTFSSRRYCNCLTCMWFQKKTKISQSCSDLFSAFLPFCLDRGSAAPVILQFSLHTIFLFHATHLLAAKPILSGGSFPMPSIRPSLFI